MLKNDHTLKINIDNYEGPLHTLLELIEQRKLSVNEISLSQVTDDFLAKAEMFKFDKELYTEFVFIASTLIYIKSKSLLPFVEEEKEEDSEELKLRLKALKELKKQSRYFLDKYKNSKRYFLSKYGKRVYKLPQEFNPYKEFNLSVAKKYILDIFSCVDITPSFTIKRRKYKSLEYFVKQINDLLRKYDKISFHDIKFENKEDKIVAFLAVLELYKKGKILIKQINSDLHIETESNKIPFYG